MANPGDDNRFSPEQIDASILGLERLGLPDEFVAGLYAEADARIMFRKRVALVASLDLLHEARKSQIAEVAGQLMLPEFVDDPWEFISPESRPNKIAARFLNEITGDEAAHLGRTQKQIEDFVPYFVGINRTLRVTGRKPSPTVETEILLHVQGVRDNDIAERTGRSSNIIVNGVRRNLMRNVHTHGWPPERVNQL